MAKKRKSNIGLVRDIMTFSRYGALSQLFVMDALIKHAAKVAAAKPEDCDSALISGEAWVGVAKEIKAKIEEAMA